MSWLQRTSRRPVGVDVGRRHIKAAQFNRGGAAWRAPCVAVARRDAADGTLVAEDARQVRQLLGSRGLRGDAVVLALPAEMVLTGILELPPRDSGAPIDRLAGQELARMHNGDPDSIEVACWDLPAPARAANTTFVMAVGCRHDDANGLMDLFEEQGLHVEALEVHACAVARACRGLIAETSGLAGILDVGWASARLVLVYRGVIVYERRLAKGGLDGLLRSLGQELGLSTDAAERLLRDGGLSNGTGQAPGEGRGAGGFAADACFSAMIDEMRIPLSYLANQYPDVSMERLVLVGGGATIPGLKEYLSAGLGVPVQVAGPTDLAPCPESFDSEHGPALAVAMGLGQFEGAG